VPQIENNYIIVALRKDLIVECVNLYQKINISIYRVAELIQKFGILFN
jgi:hypothetical protein